MGEIKHINSFTKEENAFIKEMISEMIIESDKSLIFYEENKVKNPDQFDISNKILNLTKVYLHYDKIIFENPNLIFDIIYQKHFYVFTNYLGRINDMNKLKKRKLKKSIILKITDLLNQNPHFLKQLDDVEKEFAKLDAANKSTLHLKPIK